MRILQKEASLSTSQHCLNLLGS
ncbi:hypothetical protein MED222_05255 [Vibrio sp. MED222]|nr:hypothetical protein MED222_05255 [Vibrio sp. MED222]